ncbi:hypothetical protein [Pukyongiella litopenaei]|uniref:Secreted protein n=1 Tax=Pukyongiella litopenaei TaxID=2605946 RepID=A0A2S0MTH9_9RHOB|nr:hypothetical protein [Pukyongiella litopenaei]AVO39199.2 hypothetical protein C6Y53_16760 [Pukyongiella litopenaei]
MLHTLLLLLVFPLAALAQDDDPMALQRCVWRCLADSKGADDPVYHQCVADHCSEREYGAAETALPQQWSHGTASDGVTRFAGVAAPSGDGSGFYYMCDGRGQSYVMLYAADAPAGPMTLFVSGQRFPVVLDRSRQQLTANMQPRGPFLTQVIGAPETGRLSAVDAGGKTVMQVGLAQAARAVQATIAACGY